MKGIEPIQNGLNKRKVIEFHQNLTRHTQNIICQTQTHHKGLDQTMILILTH